MRVAEIVKVGESNEIKIGFIQPFVPDEDIISNEEMKERNAERYLRRLSSERVSSSHYRTRPRKDIVYRHVRVVDQPEDPRERRSKVTFTRNTLEEDEPLPEPARAPITTTTSMRVQPTENLPRMPAKTVKIDSTQASTSSSSSTIKPTVKASTKVNKLAQPECTGSDVRKIAREEIERYRDAYWKTERSDSNIRRIAREEVERYRQAERKLEAHPDPYAHGRMVPAERRIEEERDVAEPMPWTKVTKEEKVSVSSAAPQKTQLKEQPAVTEEKSRSKSGEQEKKVQSRSLPQIRREEREQRQERLRERREKRRERRRERRERRRELENESRDSESSEDQPFSVILREAIDVATDSDPPCCLTSAEPYGVRVERKEPNDLDKFIELFEESKLPQESTPTQSRKPESTGWRAVPRGPPTPQRVKEEEIEVGRHQVLDQDQTPTEPSASQGQWTSSKSSKRTERDNWYDESVVRTIDTRSSRPYETTGSAGRESRIKSDRGSQKTSWPEAQDARRGAQDLRPGRAKSLPYPEHDSPIDRIVRPIEEVTEQSFRSGPPRSSRSTRNNDTEYIYAERIVQPADRPLGRRPFDDHPPARHVEVEEIIEWKRNPVDPPKARKKEVSPKRDRSPPVRMPKEDPSKVERAQGYEQKDYVSIEHSGDRPLRTKPFEKKLTVVGATKQDDNLTSRQHTKAELFGKEKQPPRAEFPTSQRKFHNHGKQDPRVQFSSKVDISPTPPGSDASSSEIRRFHGMRRKSGQQVDGNHNPEPYKDLNEECERRGRMRSREPGAGYDRYEERESFRDRGRDREAVIKPDRKGGDRNYDGKGRRRLARALSESPSRESLSSSKLDEIESKRKDTFYAKAGLEKLEEKLQSCLDRRLDKLDDKLDGRGPYRPPEKVTDSMRVEDWSPEGGVWDQRKRSVRRRRDV